MAKSSWNINILLISIQHIFATIVHEKMIEKGRLMRVGIFNDSFPPMIDGVSRTSLNYAHELNKKYGYALVATPWYPKVEDNYPFKVMRYASAKIGKRLGYRIGNPFSPFLIKRILKENLDLIHIHSPFTSALLARLIRNQTGSPIVFTYHTKFDVDIEKRVAFTPFRKISTKILLSNIQACDAVWTVSQGAYDNLKSLGYQGPCVIMENGTDFIKGPASNHDQASLRKKLAIKESTFTYLFVGRMMWYKNIDLILEALRQLKKENSDFKAVFVGDGTDLDAIIEKSRDLELQDQCVFTGPVHDRKLLQSYYSISNLFLFPSLYDTNGLVVKEAAACGCPALLIKGSCASESIQDQINGLLSENTLEDFSRTLREYYYKKSDLFEMGQRASQSLYLSWQESVSNACKAYEDILSKGHLKRKRA